MSRPVNGWNLRALHNMKFPISPEQVRSRGLEFQAFGERDFPAGTFAERYREMHGATHTFLRERNGIRPNTLHVIFDVSIVAILIVLGVLARQGG